MTGWSSATFGERSFSRAITNGHGHDDTHSWVNGSRDDNKLTRQVVVSRDGDGTPVAHYTKYNASTSTKSTNTETLSGGYTTSNQSKNTSNSHLSGDNHIAGTSTWWTRTTNGGQVTISKGSEAFDYDLTPEWSIPDYEELKSTRFWAASLDSLVVAESLFRTAYNLFNNASWSMFVTSTTPPKYGEATGFYDWIGKNIILPWVGEERLLKGGGLADDLLITGLVVTEMVGYVDPTPISDVANAGLNALDGNYLDASLSLAGALSPGGGDKAMKGASKAGSKVMDGLSTAGKAISKHTACDAPTAAGRVVGNVLGQCFVYETPVVYDRAPADGTSTTEIGLDGWLCILEIGLGVVVVGAFVQVHRTKRERDKRAFEELLDELFSSDDLLDDAGEDDVLPMQEGACEHMLIDDVLEQNLSASGIGEIGFAASERSTAVCRANVAMAPIVAHRRHEQTVTAAPIVSATSRRVTVSGILPVVGVLLGLLLVSHGLWSSLTPKTAVSRSRAPSFLTKPIGEIQPGEWVLADNPNGPEEEDVEISDAQHYRLVRLELEKDNGWKTVCSTIQPAEWLEANNASVGSVLELDMPEMGAVGAATVVSIAPCPEIAPRPSSEHHLVISRFEHHSDDVISLSFDGESRPVGVTSTHPIWSEDRGGFVAARELHENESLRDANGRLVRLDRIDRTARTCDVYNIEVAGEHVYYVGESAILVHNSCYNEKYGQSVYVLVNKEGIVKYVGRGDAATRKAVHRATKGRASFEMIEVSNNLGRRQAKGLEQALIDHFGGAKSQGGKQLQNLIRSFSESNAKRGIYESYGKELKGMALKTLREALE
jgi:hypothetical protein